MSSYPDLLLKVADSFKSRSFYLLSYLGQMIQSYLVNFY